MKYSDDVYYPENYRPSAKRKAFEYLTRMGTSIGLKIKPKQCLFIMSWMRSGSSLLSNLILQNSGVFGIGECHVRYSDAKSLSQIAFITAMNRRRLPRKKLVYFDKILHNHLDKDMEQEIFSNARFLFLLRDPEKSAKSIQRMWQNHPPERPATPFQYLVERMHQVEEFASKIPPHRRYLLSYEDIIDDTKRFNDLDQFLGFKLDREYRVENHVGRAGIGDFSENIRSGRIISVSKSPDIKDNTILTELQRKDLDILISKIRNHF